MAKHQHSRRENPLKQQIYLAFFILAICWPQFIYAADLESSSTVPNKPENLSIELLTNTSAIIKWNPSETGQYTGFKLNVLGHIYPNRIDFNRSFVIEGNETLQLIAEELVPGGSYHVQAYTLYNEVESLDYASANFTTKPNGATLLIVWFRNETSLRVLFEPPSYPGVYTHFQVSARESSTSTTAGVHLKNVTRKDLNQDLIEALFTDLVPGRTYNISVQTVSGTEKSELATDLFRTLPESPKKLSVDQEFTTSKAFRVRWEAPNTETDYDSFQVTLLSPQKVFLVPRSEDISRHFDYSGELEPGSTYDLEVKTVAGNVLSSAATVQVKIPPNSVDEGNE